MQVRFLLRIVSLTTVIILPSALSMGEINAMLYPNGGVTVNAAAAPSSLAISAGDKVQTSKQASAMISDGKSKIRLRENSSIVYKTNRVELSRGNAVIVTKEATTGQLDGLSVLPVSSDPTKFALVNQQGTEMIAAIEGSLRITDGTNTVLLLPGQALMHGPNETALQDGTSQDSNGQGQTSTSDDSEKQKKKRREEPAPAATGHVYRGVHNWKTVAIIAAATFSPFIGVLIYDEVTEPEDEKKNPSPSKP